MDNYNSERSHSSLEDRTPAEAYTRSLPAAPASVLLPTQPQLQAQVMNL